MLILASSSPRRLALLKQAGVTPDAIRPADIDETPFPDEKPRPYARRMAREKALAITEPDAWILAADTVVCGAARILPKAEDEATARGCLQWLSGRRHQVLTGVCLARNGKVVKEVLVTTRVTMCQLSPDTMHAYLDSGEWEGKAGGYGIQGMAEAFITDLSGSYSNVVGLPLYETMALLRRCRSAD
jgi:septum formation protein